MMRYRHAAWMLPILIALIVPGAHAQYAGEEMAEPDPAAMKAFTDLLKAHRSRPAMHVQCALTIELEHGEQKSKGEEVKVEFICAGRNAGAAKINGYECVFEDGLFWMIHAENDDGYYLEEYEDSPYWALLVNFMDLPYPHIALLWGEPDPADVCMQLVSQSPMLLPRSVRDYDKDEKQLRELTFESQHATLSMIVDRKAKQVISMTHVVTGGPSVPEGSKKKPRDTW